MSEPKKFLSVKHIVFMIIVQVLAFNNIPRCYYQMGYSAIPILILAALLFFVPYSFMMAEYGSALRDEAGGLYNWMERSLGTKFAFCGSLLNYAGTLVWFMLVVASSEWVYLSAMISGGDTTGAWSILGLTSAQTLGILGVVLTLVLTIIAVSGLENISKFFSVGGSLVMGLVGVLMVGGVLVLILNGGQFAQPLSAYGFFHSPNENYQSTGGIISFFAFAILAYGGSEISPASPTRPETQAKPFRRPCSSPPALSPLHTASASLSAACSRTGQNSAVRSTWAMPRSSL